MDRDHVQDWQVGGSSHRGVVCANDLAGRKACLHRCKEVDIGTGLMCKADRWPAAVMLTTFKTDWAPCCSFRLVSYNFQNRSHNCIQPASVAGTL